MRRVLRLLLLATVGGATLSAAASGAVGVRLAAVDTAGYPEVRVTVVAPSGSSAPQIEENGIPVTGEQAVSLAASKSIVLAVDRSRSMAGRSLRNATAAARALVATTGTADDVEVIAFGHTARTLSPFSHTASDADAALSGMAVDRVSGTALWDAVVLAAKGLAHAPGTQGRVIVVVTDGRDVSSSASFQQAVTAAHRAHAAVYAVGIASPDFAPAQLRALTAETGGTFLQASASTELVTLYRSIGRTLARTWQIRYATAARPGDRLRLTAVVPGSRSSVRVVRLAGASAAVPVTEPALLSRSMWQSKLAPLVLAGAVGLLMLVAALFGFAARGRNWLTARLEPHLAPAQRRKGGTHRRDARALMKRLFAATEHTFADVKQFRTLQRMLARADLPLLAAELVYICLGSAVVFTLLAALAGGSAFMILLFLCIGVSGPVLFVAFKARARIRAFDDQLPDLLTTIAASLKAGHSFRHAIQAVVDEGADPAAKEFRRVLTETRLGKPMDEALSDLSERIGSKNLTFALMAVTIQRQIGGSLAGLFDMVADTVRQRQQFARKIRALTAMGRMSAYVLVALPFVVALAVTALNSAYMSPLWGTPTGHELVGAGLAMIMFGSLILRKIVTFRG